MISPVSVCLSSSFVVHFQFDVDPLDIPPTSSYLDNFGDYILDLRVKYIIPTSGECVPAGISILAVLVGIICGKLYSL